jgi:hypothetical protein
MDQYAVTNLSLPTGMFFFMFLPPLFETLGIAKECAPVASTYKRPWSDF